MAFLTDIKGMFHQFVVSEEYCDLLRFLWWKDGNPDNETVEYRMKVHLFGAASSPGCANFGLRKAADDGEEEFGANHSTRFLCGRWCEVRANCRWSNFSYQGQPSYLF